MKINIIFKLMVLSFFLFLWSSCDVSDKNKYLVFQKYLNQGNEEVLSKDYQKAEESFLSANRIAEEINWTDGIVIANRNIAFMHIASKDHVQAEMFYDKARRICLDKKDCSFKQLEMLYDQQIFFYLSIVRNVDQAEKLIDEMISSSQKFGGNGTIKLKLNQYSKDMEKAGYTKNAEALINLSNSL